MIVIIFLALAALSVAAGFLGAFIWATKDGQFDDTYTPSIRMLFDPKQKKTKEPKPEVE